MKETEIVKSLIKKPIEKEGFILDDVLLEKEGKMLFLRVVIDKKSGYVDVDDCVTICHVVNPILDEADPIKDSYILDVCSKEKGSE